MKLITTEGVSKVYQMGEVEVKALKDINLNINDGELIVILGPSGSGKSTLLNILGGMDLPTTGKVFYKNTEVTHMKDKQLTFFRRHNIGFVFQFYNLMANLTVKENVELATEICKNPLSSDEVLEAVGLRDRKNHFPSQLSGGEQQRVAIARAIAKNPDILLCDEPTGALDYKTGIEVLKVIQNAHEKYKKTIILITHNAAISGIADRIIKMRSGEIISDKINTNKIKAEEIEW